MLRERGLFGVVVEGELFAVDGICLAVDARRCALLFGLGREVSVATRKSDPRVVDLGVGGVDGPRVVLGDY